MRQKDKHPVSSALFGASAIQVTLAWMAWASDRMGHSALDWLDIPAFSVFLVLGIGARWAPIPAAVTAAVLYGAFLVRQASISIELLVFSVVFKIFVVVLLLVALVLAFKPRKETEQVTGSESATPYYKAFQILCWTPLKAFCILGFGLALSHLVDPLVSSSLRHAELRPTEDMNTVEDFTARFGPECGWLLLNIEGQIYYETRIWPGTSGSGDACYVFDDKGCLADWTPDGGNDSTWNEKWRQGERARPIPFSYMMDKIEPDT